ncbi:globin [Marinobacterium zhoushanense]|uniref:Globin n=1 Tax=Marinobacterium zhoushanense TaxID=1679163 RepID=A0ABQ1K7B7_9GAMM|nr:group II truncated hemoglobin [Marinobacterium zhoushanense]GGB86733.1 globin [Marinobacterium zhoushanense]
MSDKTDTHNPLPYGTGDATYRAAGGIEGITALVDRFYELMDSLPEARALREMHPADLTQSRQKLAYFLSGWMGGPRLFSQHYGSIIIPEAHKQFPVDMDSKNAWLRCMEQALIELEYPEDFRHYLMKQLAIPAEVIRARAQMEAQSRQQ